MTGREQQDDGVRDDGPEPVRDDDPTRRVGMPRLGRYELHQRVGWGGMAEVFLARETGAAGLDRWVAIKRIHPALARQRRFVEMLLDEARIAARISHPNVAQVLDLGEADGIPYIVMEYLHGQPLSAVIARTNGAEGRPGVPAVVDLMARIVAHAAEGAHAAHELRDRDGRPLGIVHRDLSPHNVFVTYEGAVKVVDFGIAKAKGRATMTEPGTLKGKFSYMSPEQGRGAPLDRRSDVYALGLVLYETTTGERVYDGDDRAVLAQVQLSQIDPPSRGRKGYPAALDAIVLRALARDPADRTPTARDLGQELDRLLVARQAPTGPAEIATLMLRLFPEPSRSRIGQPAGSTPAGTASSSSPAPASTRTRTAPERPPTTRRVGLLAAAAAVVCGLAVALGWTMMRSPHPDPLPVPGRGGARDESAARASARATHDMPGASAIPSPSAELRAPSPSAETRAASPSPSAELRAPSPTPSAELRAPSPSAEPRAASPTPSAELRAPSPRPEARAASPSADARAPGVVPERRPSRAHAAPRPEGERGRGEGSAAAAAAPAAPGTLDVRSEPWATVSVDGRRLQPTPVVALPLAAGPHTVRLVTEDGRTKRIPIVVSPGRPTRLDVRF